MASVPERPRRKSRRRRWGSISQRENGDCRAQYTAAGGKRISSPWFKTWDEAEEWLAQAHAAQLDNKKPMTSRHRLDPIALRPTEAAEVISLDYAEFDNLINNGSIPSFKVGKVRLVAVADLKAWVDAQRPWGAKR